MKKIMFKFLTFIILSACSNGTNENNEYDFSIGMNSVSFINLPKTHQLWTVKRYCQLQDTVALYLSRIVRNGKKL